MTTCALPGCDKPARSTRKNSCCCGAHARAVWHAAKSRYKGEVVIRNCAYCGEPFVVDFSSPGGRRMYHTEDCYKLAKLAKQKQDRELRRAKREKIAHLSKPHVERKWEPAPAGLTDDQRIEYVVRMAYQSADDWGRRVIAARNPHMRLEEAI